MSRLSNLYPGESQFYYSKVSTIDVWTYKKESLGTQIVRQEGRQASLFKSGAMCLWASCSCLLTSSVLTYEIKLTIVFSSTGWGEISEIQSQFENLNEIMHVACFTGPLTQEKLAIIIVIMCNRIVWFLFNVYILIILHIHDCICLLYCIFKEEFFYFSHNTLNTIYLLI